MHKFPFDLGFVLKFPNKKIYGFSILGQKLINIISNIERICIENNINIIDIKISAFWGGERTYFLRLI